MQMVLCRCGKDVGFVFTCIICEGSCCISCTDPNSDIEICPTCNNLQNSIIEAQAIVAEADRVRKLCIKCDKPYTSSGPCYGHGCKVMINYCNEHLHTCDAKGCHRGLCDLHTRCFKHSFRCTFCFHKGYKAKQCPVCTKYVCPTCENLDMPYAHLGINICRRDFVICNRCIETRCIYMPCIAPDCKKTKGFCLSCDRMPPTKYHLTICDSHRGYCNYCNTYHLATLASKYNGCDPCLGKIRFKLYNFLLILRASGIPLPLDMRRLIFEMLLEISKS
ncbi:MAG: hypothetical protein ACMG6E_06100 [Candidatus Roizmanbacteria bacterium]